MFNAFDKMIVNFQQILDDACAELSLDLLSIEELYSRQSLCGQDFADTLDRAVRHLLQAESDRIGYALQVKEVRLAEDIILGVLERLKAEKSTEWAPTLPVAEFDGGSHSPDGLSALGDEGMDGASSRVSRKGATVFVEVAHDSETNFFTDLSSEITRGGLFVATYDILRTGTPLNVHLSLPCGRSFPLQGSVSWVREYENCAEGASPGMGITFQQLSSELKAAVNRYMTVRPPLLFEMA
jgi:uncharacterized protein (TIGR02266 family)